MTASSQAPSGEGLIALIARLEAASYGTTELSAEIARDAMGQMVHQWPFWFRATSFDGFENSAIVPVVPYTTSLDAALTLVPEGLFWYVQAPHSYQRAKGEPFTATAAIKGKYGWADSGLSWHGEAQTAPLALCIAALKARQASQGEKP